MVYKKYRQFSTLLTTAILIAAFFTMTGCKSVSAEESTPMLTAVTPTAPTSTPTFLPTATLPPPTPMVTLSGGVSQNDEEKDAGVILLAMETGPHRQIYAYHPLYLSMSRVTNGDWDYDDPSISPDGRKIAYCANQSGVWEIYILDLISGTESQLTHSGGYACSPSWSPDGQWLAYEQMVGDKLTILLSSTSDGELETVQLSDATGNNFDPAWSPGGRMITFTTDRNGRLEIWAANLDAPEDRLSSLIASTEADFSNAVWSPQGDKLAWQKTGEYQEIQWTDPTTDLLAITIGSGSHPAWIGADQSIAAILKSPNRNALIGYGNDPAQLLFPPMQLKGEISTITWKAGDFSKNIRSYLANHAQPSENPWLEAEEIQPDPENGKIELVYLEDVEVSHPYLSGGVNDHFQAMRSALATDLGWDFLGILESAQMPLPNGQIDTFINNWLYTGRAIAVNLEPMDAGYLQVSREEIDGRTYWRVWLKCKDQSGICGEPIQGSVWDFNARFNENPAGFQNGGQPAPAPVGYWIDFTSYALKYGWERFPADASWRSYFPAANIQLFAQKDNLTWQQAMLQSYSPEQIEGLMP